MIGVRQSSSLLQDDIDSIDSRGETRPDLYFVLWRNGEEIFRSEVFENVDFDAIDPGDRQKEGSDSGLWALQRQHIATSEVPSVPCSSCIFALRLTNCEHPGVPRWLWEPHIKEFVNLPSPVMDDE